MADIEELLSNNEDYARVFRHGDLPAPPARKLAVVACMDARMDVHKILGLAEGDAHIIRNAGGVVTEDALRSLLISQRLLGTRKIVILQHTECGMQSFDEQGLSDEIEAETGIRPPFPLGAFADVEESLRDSLELIRSTPLVPHRAAVRAFLYDIRTGRLREVT